MLPSTTTAGSTYAPSQLLLLLKKLAVLLLLQLLLLLLPSVASRASGTQWRLTFEDTFSRATIDSSVWSVRQCPCYHNGTWTPDAVTVHDGVLEIRTELQRTADGAMRSTSGHVNTSTVWRSAGGGGGGGGFSQRYGKFEVRARVPGAAGISPAIWMMPDDAHVCWPAGGEIDIAETTCSTCDVAQNVNGTTPFAWGTLHYSPTNGCGNEDHKSVSEYWPCMWQAKGCQPTTNLADDFHVYSVVWKKGSMEWAVDGQTYNYINATDVGPYNASIPQRPFYFILQSAVTIQSAEHKSYCHGNTFDPSRYPVSFLIDWVRAYEEVPPPPPPPRAAARPSLAVPRARAPNRSIHLRRYHQPMYNNNRGCAQNVTLFANPLWKLHVSSCTCLATAAAYDGSTGVWRTGVPVPLLQFYNRVSDARPENLSPCTSVEEISSPTRHLLRVHASYDAGSINLSVTSTGDALFFRVHSLGGWIGADPIEKHLAFGEFWSGILCNATAPIVMGRLQGPRGIPGTGEISAGFMTISPRSYFRYIFNVQEQDELAFGFAASSSADVAQLWTRVASARSIPVLNNANRFNTYVWADVSEATALAMGTRAVALGAQVLMLLGQGGRTAWHELGAELTVNRSVFPSGINHTVELLRESLGLKVGLHMHPDIVWPCLGSTDFGCLTTGVSVSPAAEKAAKLGALMAEGLAPTFRSGIPPHASGHNKAATEDLGFWWAHGFRNGDNETAARNGNPKPCGQGSCNPRDWAHNDWAPDIVLSGTSWSTAGFFRGGGAINFDGQQSRAHLPTRKLDGHSWGLERLRDEITIGLVVHPVDGDDALVAEEQVLWSYPGVFELVIDVSGRLRWAVFNITATMRSPLCPRPCVPPRRGFAVKATFNASCSAATAAKIFVGGRLVSSDSSDTRIPWHGPRADAMYIGAAPSQMPMNFTQTAGKSGGQWSRHFQGALEELYIKNVSTEHRSNYMFADDCRTNSTSDCHGP
jgi:beta-glucanase (GH16 family)